MNISIRSIQDAEYQYWYLTGTLPTLLSDSGVLVRVFQLMDIYVDITRIYMTERRRKISSDDLHVHTLIVVTEFLNKYSMQRIRN